MSKTSDRTTPTRSAHTPGPWVVAPADDRAERCGECGDVITEGELAERDDIPSTEDDAEAAEGERLTCSRCGADLGPASDPYRDPDCAACIARDAQEEAEADDRAEDGELIVCAPGNGVPDQWGICTIWDDGVRSAPNARLIAAAPDLLALVRRMRVDLLGSSEAREDCDRLLARLDGGAE